MSDPRILYALGGLALLLLVGLVRWWRRRVERDPLPERDPKCVWHSEVLKVERVYDGDTFFAHVKGHKPLDGKAVGIRLRGIDTPERKDKRAGVKKKAEAARTYLEEELRQAKKIHLYNVSMADKYGRMLATVFCDNRDVARRMLKKRLAKPYDGGTKKAW